MKVEARFILLIAVVLILDRSAQPNFLNFEL